MQPIVCDDDVNNGNNNNSILFFNVSVNNCMNGHLFSAFFLSFLSVSLFFTPIHIFPSKRGDPDFDPSVDTMPQQDRPKLSE